MKRIERPDDIVNGPLNINGSREKVVVHKLPLHWRKMVKKQKFVLMKKGGGHDAQRD